MKAESKHYCHARGCLKVIPPKLLMCPPHWRMVPPDLQAKVWATYRPGQEVDKNPSNEYIAAQQAAVRIVAIKDGYCAFD